MELSGTETGAVVAPLESVDRDFIGVRRSKERNIHVTIQICSGAPARSAGCGRFRQS